MINWEKFAKRPTLATIETYPTIVDILEDILESEGRVLSGRSPLSCTRDVLYEMEIPGRYVVMAESNTSDQAVLMPTNREMFTFYRGENEIYDTCKPSLLRFTDEEKILLARLQTEELRIVLNSHPVIKFILNEKINPPVLLKGFFLKVQTDAIAQHYGIATPFVDITNDKWVAAFFAISKKEKDEYRVVSPNNHADINSRCGSFYRLKNVDFFSSNAPIPIGMQYFNRPGKQSALLVNLNEIKDFLLYPNVERVYFRHDDRANQLVFDLCQQGKKYFPEDSLVPIVEKLCTTRGFSSAAVEACNTKYYFGFSKPEMMKYMEKYHIECVDKPSVCFNQYDVDLEWMDWEKEGIQRYLNSLLVMPFY